MLNKNLSYLFIFIFGTFFIVNVLAHVAVTTNSPPGDRDQDTIWEESKDISDEHPTVTATAKATKYYLYFPDRDDPVRYVTSLEGKAHVTASNIKCPNETEVEARGKYELTSIVSKFDVEQDEWVEWFYGIDSITPPMEYRGEIDVKTTVIFYDTELLPKYWDVAGKGTITNEAADSLQLGRHRPKNEPPKGKASASASIR